MPVFCALGVFLVNHSVLQTPNTFLFLLFVFLRPLIDFGSHFVFFFEYSKYAFNLTASIFILPLFLLCLFLCFSLQRLAMVYIPPTLPVGYSFLYFYINTFIFVVFI